MGYICTLIIFLRALLLQLKLSRDGEVTLSVPLGTDGQSHLIGVRKRRYRANGACVPTVHLYLTMKVSQRSGAACKYETVGRLYVHAPIGCTSTALNLVLLDALVPIVKAAPMDPVAVIVQTSSLVRTNLAGTCTVIRRVHTFLPSGQGRYSSGRSANIVMPPLQMLKANSGRTAGMCMCHNKTSPQQERLRADGIGVGAVLPMIAMMAHC